MVQIGDKYVEKMPSFVGNGHEVFSWNYTVVGFTLLKYGVFAKCIRTFKDGTQQPLRIAVDLLNDETFYKKIA